MKTLLKAEFNKLFHSRMFWATLAVGTVVTLASAVQCFMQYDKDLKYFLLYRDANGNFTRDPSWQMSSVFNNWIGNEGGMSATSLFYMLLPLLAALPFAWTYCTERRGGYIKNVLTRSRRRDYYLSKFIAAFVSGALAAAVPMLINLMVIMTRFPIVKPDIEFYPYYSIVSYIGGSEIFYSYPWLWVVIRLIMAMAFCGAVADMALAISVVVKNKFAVAILPFIFFLAFNFFTNPAFYSRWELSPMRNLGALSTCPTSLWYIFGLDVVLLAVSFGVFMIWGEKKDVF